MHIVRYATCTARPGNETTVTRLIKNMAAEARQEPGTLLFEVSTFADNPRRFFIYQVYTDQAAFDAHISAPYSAVFTAALNELIEEPRSQLTSLIPVEREVI